MLTVPTAGAVACPLSRGCGIRRIEKQRSVFGVSLLAIGVICIISAIVIGGLNAIDSIVENNNIDYEVSDGYVRMSNLSNVEVQNILKIYIKRFRKTCENQDL